MTCVAFSIPGSDILSRSHSQVAVRIVHALVVAAVVCVLPGAAGPARANVVLNEVAPRIERADAPSLLDEDGAANGFVELFNGGPGAVDLDGWRLLADEGARGEWSLPPVTLAAGDVLRIWTSGKHRSDPALPLHADFHLVGVERVSLLDAHAGLVDEVPLAVPTDRSYGRCGSAWYYFSMPSPGRLNPATAQMPLVTLSDRLSLTAGRPHQLVALPFQDLSWSSGDPALSLLSSGRVVAPHDASPGAPQPSAEVWSASVGTGVSVPVTIVPWIANTSSLVAMPTPAADHVLGSDAQGVYFARGMNLHRSSDGMKSDVLLGPLPAAPSSGAQLHSTPFGFIYRTGASIHHSPDLVDWTSAFTASTVGLRSGFATHWDAAAQTGTVLVSEYSTESARRHAVHRGTFDASGHSTWETVIEFSSLDEAASDPTLDDVARHVHVSTLDPYTGEAWVGTGDASVHARILVESPGGGFDVLGMGDQSWRTLGIWFSPTHVYWNMDSSAAQSVWRVPRSMRHPVHGWPSITPELDGGATRPGVRYLVLADASGMRFPVAIGQVFIETAPRPLDPSHRVRALDDPAYDYRERVAELAGAAHWFQMWVSDERGDPISIMSTAADGWRDTRARVFGFKERPDGTVDVQELLSISASPVHSSYAQLEPVAQDPSGYVYFAGRKTARPLYQMRLDWADDHGAPTGGPSAAANAVVPPSPEMCVVSVPEPGVPLGLLAGATVLAGLARRRRAGARAVADPQRETAHRPVRLG